MAWPGGTVNTTGMDADLDNIPRTDILTLTQYVNTIIGARGQASGICETDAGNKIPTTRLPTVPLTQGGTGATDQASARAALGLGSMATQNSNAVSISAGSVNAGTMQRNGFNLWGPDNDGSGTGLDADTLDGLHATAFAAAGSYMTQIYTAGGDVSLVNYYFGAIKGISSGSNNAVDPPGIQVIDNGSYVTIRYNTGSFGGCFPEWTPVHTPRGVRAIQNIKVGDMVYGCGGEAVKVLGLLRPMVNARWMWSFGDLLTTGDHLFVTPLGWACVEPAIYQLTREAQFIDVFDYERKEKNGDMPKVAEIMRGSIPSFEVKRLRRFFPLMTIGGLCLTPKLERRRVDKETRLYGLWVSRGVYAVGERGYLVDGFPQE